MSTTTPGLGSKSFIQIGKESSWGVPVSATLRLEIQSGEIPPQIGVIDDTSLYNGASWRALYPGGLYYKGTLICRCNYEGMLKFFEGALGTITTGSALETVLYDSTAKESIALPSYTIEDVQGDIPTGTCADFAGCKINKLTMKGKVGQNTGLVTVEIEVLAKDMQIGQFLSPSKLLQIVNCSTSGSSTTVTRASGNFTTDGVHVGDQVSGAGVTAATTVATVGTTTLTLSSAMTIPTGTTLSFTAAAIDCTTVSSTTLSRVSGSFLVDGVSVGDTITGAGIPAGTTVAGSITATSLIMSAAATASASNIPVQFAHVAPAVLPVLFQQGPAAMPGLTCVTNSTTTVTSSALFGNVLVGDLISGPGIPAGAVVTAVASSSSVTISIAATASATTTLVFQHPAVLDGSWNITGGVAGDAPGSVRVRDFEFMIDNKLLEDRFYGGAQNFDEPLRGAQYECTWKLTQEFITRALLDKAKSFVAGSLRIFLQHPSIPTGASTLHRELEIRSNTAQLVGYNNVRQGYGIILATANWRATQDSTDASAAVIRNRNTQSAA